MDGNEALMAEARSLVAEASSRGLGLRLVGGMAVRATCPSSREDPFARICDDLDFFSDASASSLEALFVSRDWKPDPAFNLYNGHERLKFLHTEMKKNADIFLGRFRMCHEIRLDMRRSPGAATVSPAELLLTKLQVVEADAKDLLDTFCILADHELGPSEEEGIDSKLFASACAEDWGLQKTVELSLDRLCGWIETEGLDRSAGRAVAGRIATLRAVLRSEPKSLAWKLRSALGTRVRWFELPEEAER
ncbi:MAG: hypothetical protein ACLQMF_01805 [Rectinemataceae bacterium]